MEWDRMQMYLAVVITKNQMNNESDERNILQNAPAITVWRAKWQGGRKIEVDWATKEDNPKIERWISKSTSQRMDLNWMA